MIDVTTAASTTDAQDPLPESTWLWRRLLSFAIVAFIEWQLLLQSNRIARFGDKSPDHGIDALLNLCHWLIGLFGGILILYLVAPSAEQVAKMLATLSAWKSGVSTASYVKTQSSEGDSAEKTVTGGPAAVPPSPPISPAPSAGSLGDLPWRSNIAGLSA